MTLPNRLEIRIRPFQPRDQSATKNLILAGLIEHWGTLDPTLNPDLSDIARYYQDQTFLLAVQGNEIVGCGALVEEKGMVGYGRIVRMSVMKKHRRHGIGQCLLGELEFEARRRGFFKIVLETTETWKIARKFYLANGYQIVENILGDTHFEKEI